MEELFEVGVVAFDLNVRLGVVVLAALVVVVEELVLSFISAADYPRTPLDGEVLVLIEVEATSDGEPASSGTVSPETLRGGLIRAAVKGRANGREAVRPYDHAYTGMVTDSLVKKAGKFLRKGRSLGL